MCVGGVLGWRLLLGPSEDGEGADIDVPSESFHSTGCLFADERRVWDLFNRQAVLDSSSQPLNTSYILWASE